MSSSASPAPARRLGMSERDYAAHAGISRGAVQKARSSGRRVLPAAGSTDAAASDARRPQATNPAMQRGRHSAASRAVPTAAVEAVAGTLREHAATSSPTAGGMTYLQARTANEVLKAQERKIKVEALKGTLIDAEEAGAAVFRMARQARDAWQNWPSRVSALMAAELGVDEHVMHTVLAREVREQLQEISEMDFTGEMARGG